MDYGLGTSDCIVSDFYKLFNEADSKTKRPEISSTDFGHFTHFLVGGALAFAVWAGGRVSVSFEPLSFDGRGSRGGDASEIERDSGRHAAKGA